MKIVDCYGVNDGSTFFSVELAEDRFVDVKVCEGNPEGLVYVMQNEDGSTVYSDRAYSDNRVDFTHPGFEYDEKAVLKLVKETLKEFGRDCMRDDGSFPLPCFLRGLRDKVLSGQMTVQDAAFELGFKRWTTVYSAETARALMQLPREHLRVAIESTWDCAENDFRPKLVRNDSGAFEIQNFFRIVCVNELCGLGDLFEPLDDRVFECEEDAKAAVEKDANLILIGYEELKHEAIDYLTSKPVRQEAQGQAVVAEILGNAESRAEKGLKGDNGKDIEL